MHPTFDIEGQDLSAWHCDVLFICNVNIIIISCVTSFVLQLRESELLGTSGVHV